MTEADEQGWMNIGVEGDGEEEEDAPNVAESMNPNMSQTMMMLRRHSRADRQQMIVFANRI